MDPVSDCTGPATSHYLQSPTTQRRSGGCIIIRKRFEKSESEDSGVELLPPSPFGSESSYNPDESESLESSTPEDPERLDSPTPEDPESPKIEHTIENQGSLEQSEETVILEDSAPKNKESFKMPEDKDIDPIERFFSHQPKRDMSGVPHKLEQAILRSRRQRSSSKESIHNRTARHNRQHMGSHKDQRRGRTFSCQTKSPMCQSQENKDQDPLNLPGDGLRYLESLCQMLEQIAELQQKNQRLQQEKREAEERRHNQVLFLDSCVCGASSASRDSDNDLPDSHHRDESTWEPKHYRKRSSSHAGVLLSMARPTDNVLKRAAKMDPQYVSVPNLKEEERRPHRNYKTEASQWYRVKDMLSKFTRKGAGTILGTGQAAEMRNNCRTQTILEGNSQHPKRLFLPGLVIRPRSNVWQFP
ncbi:hypothetical protein GDO78_004892 [Eleutherodactylus coqui]|uniref:DUF4657 domain-containing protein n=1 Tax=Eleutherodactylus coqui TaxID=57060 RepID=A0A8J6KEC6_ELECQ|nr:hypothetical protein GDO78_004892 [Eleutherodactylus coqui]